MGRLTVNKSSAMMLCLLWLPTYTLPNTQKINELSDLIETLQKARIENEQLSAKVTDLLDQSELAYDNLG